MTYEKGDRETHVSRDSGNSVLGLKFETYKQKNKVSDSNIVDQVQDRHN